MENKYYDDEERGIRLHTAGAVIKYGSLMLGVYSVCKDEKDFVLATIGVLGGGLGYLLGELFHRAGEQFSNAKNLSKLEESLKE